jgi:hypothetical protein
MGNWVAFSFPSEHLVCLENNRKIVIYLGNKYADN